MRRCLMLLAILALGFAPAPFFRPERPPRSPMLGHWVGHERGNYIIGSAKLLVTPDRMFCGESEFALKIDASTRPARYHIMGVPGGKAAGWEGRGIWRVEGDVLTITYNSLERPLPTAFAGDGQGVMVVVYRRAGR